MSKKMVEIALEFARRGYYVIPIAPDGKKPCINFADKPAMSSAQIVEHWGLHPNDMIALRTVNHFVIDVDKHNGVDGTKALDSIPKDLLPPTYTEFTPTGGIHFLYKKPENFSLKPLQMIGLFAGIDIKAHPNSYAIVAPSVSVKGKYVAGQPFKLTTAPLALIDYLQEIHDKKEQISGGTLRDGNSNDKFAATSWTGNLINELAASYEVGSRNDTIAYLTGKLLRTGADLDSIATLLEFVNKRFYREIEGRKVPAPLDERELSKTFNSILQRELSKNAKDGF